MTTGVFVLPNMAHYVFINISQEGLEKKKDLKEVQLVP